MIFFVHIAFFFFWIISLGWIPRRRMIRAKHMNTLIGLISFDRTNSKFVLIWAGSELPLLSPQKENC